MSKVETLIYQNTLLVHRLKDTVRMLRKIPAVGDFTIDDYRRLHLAEALIAEIEATEKAV